MKRLRISLLIVVLFLVIIYSIRVAKSACPDGLYSDFSTYWNAGNLVLDKSIPNENLYNDTFHNLYLKYDASEKPMPYVYSTAVAYIFSFLTIFKYDNAKLFMNILNIVIYLSAIVISLRTFKVSKERYVPGLTFALIFTPFINNQHWIATDAILLLLIVLGVASAKDRPYLSGVFIGIAALFKLFPFAVALVLGTKNWRILFGSAIIFGLTMFIPGSLNWFGAIEHVSRIYSPIFKWLSEININYFFVYASLIVTITAILSFSCAKYANYSLLTSFAVAAALLVMPVVEYHFLTLLIFPYLYIIYNESISWHSIMVGISFLSVYFGLITAIYGVLVLWVSLLIYIYVGAKKQCNQSILKTC